MISLNLLPWREAASRRRRRELIAVTAAGLAATLLLGWGLHLHMEGLISGQQNRNRFLRNEIAQLDEQIHEIRDLAQTKQRLLGRMQVIHRLRTSRPEMVHLFGELVLAIPTDVHLTRISQSGRSVVLDGHARSNAGISTFMHNIGTSRWIGKPVLMLIEHKDETGTGLSRFRLRFEQLAPTGKGAGATGVGT